MYSHQHLITNFVAIQEWETCYPYWYIIYTTALADKSPRADPKTCITDAHFQFKTGEWSTGCLQHTRTTFHNIKHLGSQSWKFHSPTTTTCVLKTSTAAWTLEMKSTGCGKIMQSECVPVYSERSTSLNWSMLTMHGTTCCTVARRWYQCIKFCFQCEQTNASPVTRKHETRTNPLAIVMMQTLTELHPPYLIFCMHYNYNNTISQLWKYSSRQIWSWKHLSSRCVHFHQHGGAGPDLHGDVYSKFQCLTLLRVHCVCFYAWCILDSQTVCLTTVCGRLTTVSGRNCHGGCTTYAVNPILRFDSECGNCNLMLLGKKWFVLISVGSGLHTAGINASVEWSRVSWPKRTESLLTVYCTRGDYVMLCFVYAPTLSCFLFDLDGLMFLQMLWIITDDCSRVVCTYCKYRGVGFQFWHRAFSSSVGEYTRRERRERRVACIF